MEDTQAIDWDVEEEEETERSSDSLEYSLEPVGRLRIFSGAHGPEKDFPLFLGKNVVGRLPECSVALPFPSISKQHAVIEISAWNKAPVLQDCGSLNGTQILRPPKVLSPGVRHRLRDQELVLFADLPCQYHRLHVPLPFASRGPLTVEETPRVQGGTQSSRPPLAEDSEEEIDFLSERCVVRESRSTSSPLSTIVPESDEEGPSLAPSGSGTSFPFNLDSDTGEEDGQQPAAGGVSSAAKKGAPAEAEQPEAGGVTADVRLVKAQPSLKRSKDKKVKRETENGVILERSQPPREDSDTDVDEESSPGRAAGVHLERARPSGFMDSDTDSEEGIPATPAVVPMKKSHIFQGVGARCPEAPAGSDTDVEVPLQRSQTSIVIESDTDDEEEVSAALALARLKEGRAVSWNRDTDMKEDRAQPVLLLEESHTTSGRDSDTDVEEEGLPVGKREVVSNGHTGKDGTLVAVHSKKDQPPLEDSDVDEEADTSSSGIHLEGSQASTVDINTEVKEEVPPGPAVRHLEEPVEGTNQTDANGDPAKLPGLSLGEAQPPSEDGEIDMEEGTSSAASAAAGLRKRQWERTLDVGTRGGSLGAQVEQVVVHTDTPGESMQPQREGAQTPTGRERKPPVSKTKDSDGHDDSEDPDLQATQCFLERDSQSLEAVQTLEDEPTQAFLFAPPQEPGSSHGSSLTPGILDDSWEVLSTQPFCPGESKASEPQPIATHLEAHGSRPSPSRATPPDQHPENTAPLGTQDREMQTVEKDMGTPKEAERETPERGPLEREMKEGPPGGEREDGMEEEEITRGIRDREQKPLLAGDTQGQGLDMQVESMRPERGRESLAVEMETSQEIPEKEIEKQTHTREIFERVVEKPAPEREREPAGVGVTLEGGEVEGGSQDQNGQASSPTSEPGVGARGLQGRATPPIVSGRRSGGGRGAPVSPKSQPRGHGNCKMTPAETTTAAAAGGGPESSDACLPPTVPRASALPPEPLISQSQKHPASQPLPSSEPPIPRTRHNRTQKALEPPLSPELEASHPKRNVRPRYSSRKTPPPLSAAFEPQPTNPPDQPTVPDPMSWAPQGRTRRSSVQTPELQPSAPADQPVIPKPTPRATRGRTDRSSARTPEPVVPTAPELQPAPSTVQHVTPKPTSQVTRGRTHGSSVETPEPVVPTGPEPQPSTSVDQPVTPKPTIRATRGRTNRSSVNTPEPAFSTAPELQSSTSANQSVTPKPTSWAIRGRTNRSSAKTPEPVVPTAPELQPPLSTDQPVTPKPTSRITRGRTNRSSVETPEPVFPVAPELRSSASADQPVTPKPTSRATRGRTNRSSVNTPEPVSPTTLELQPSAPTEQPITPTPTSADTQDRTHGSPVKTPEPIVPTPSEPQPSTSTDQPVALKPRATRGSTNRSSAKTPEPVVPTAPEPQPSTSTDQPVTPKPRATRGSTKRSSAKTPEPVVPTAPEPQPSTSTDQPVTPKPRATRGSTNRSSAKTPEPVVPTAPESQPPTSTDQLVTPKPMSRIIRGKTRKSSIETPEPPVPGLKPPPSTDQPVAPKATAQSRTPRSSTLSAVTVPATPELQAPVTTDKPAPLEPIPQASCSRRQGAAGKPSSLPAPPEPKSRSARNQRAGALRAAESLGTIPEPSCSQLPQTSIHAPQKVEAEGRSGFTPEPQAKTSQSRKRPSATTDSTPLQKRLQKGEVSQKIVLPKEEDTAERPKEEEDAVLPGPSKRKRDQAEEEPRGIPSRSLRRTKPNQESAPPKVLFTGVMDARGERAVLALGGTLASSVAEASHLVTDRIRRTVKFLCALGKGIPILSLDWLHQSRRAGCFLPPDQYVVTDPEQEMNFGFSLRDSLNRARERRLLEGYEIYVTPGVQPPPPQMGEIISCCGGTVLSSMPRSYKPLRVVITCPQDFPRCLVPSRLGLPLLSPEFLLTGVLKQEAKPEAFVLSTSKVSST